MSLDHCTKCRDLIDTDDDPDCYLPSGDAFCEPCRESMGDVEPDYEAVPFAKTCERMQAEARALK